MNPAEDLTGSEAFDAQSGEYRFEFGSFKAGEVSAGLLWHGEFLSVGRDPRS
jgi:hypothetical protein